MSADIVSVTGGSAGLAATYAAVRELADTYDAAGSRLRGWAALGAETMTDPDLAESAILAPLTFAEAEAAVLAATTGPDGVLVESCGWEVDAVAVRAAVAALETADALVRAAVDQVDHAVGRSVGFTLGATAPGLVPLLATTLPLVPPGVWHALEDWVVAHPGVVQHAANGGGGVLEGLWDGTTPLAPGGPVGLPLVVPDAAAGAGLLALLYGPAGHAAVTGLPGVRGGPDAQPGDLAGLISHLHDVADLSPDPDSPLNGTIEIQTLDAGTDHVRHIVYLPGTDDIATLPWTQDDDTRDSASDLASAAGHQTVYQQGILQAMVQAGIGPHDPVLLVGHSLGGMEAAAILGRGGDGFNVTNVVTAGSPTAQVDGFPAGSHLLSLEHHGDVVPLLDGADNPDSVEQATVTFDDEPTGILDAHDYHHYVAGAAAADASADPSVREQLASLHAHGFLGAGGATTEAQVFQIVRQP
ncbi:hypothetical protein [Nocardioides sp. T2.26MG-1]|uniref:hypothetical protein n=1 Tax=Nocardioides sp. T2.26MG-1 TaxID=3041166 RepID=UPI0024774E6F|nr:hypothetical protein [Nocardioides sp. T2.26MG-1]CAI9401267.1 hypothetical protein HIDPHFAB_00575 [Nocardioides sp. T2.26MG-1]